MDYLNVMFNNFTTVMLSGPLNVTITVPGGPGGPVNPVSPLKEKRKIEDYKQCAFIVSNYHHYTFVIMKNLILLHLAINTVNISLCFLFNFH